jgi:glycerophosphoryl diester phosphodiesterase
VGAHEIEFDVRVTRDGVLVVCHDATVDRTTDGTGKVADLSWQEVRRLDAGVYAGAAWRTIRIPRLEEVLDIAGDRVGLNIHIKDEGDHGMTVKRVCDGLIERGLTSHAYLALDTESALQVAMAYAPDIPRACLAHTETPSVAIAIAERYACQRIQFRRNVTEDHIRRAHDLGMICNLFWSDDPEDGRAYLQQGIDGLLTNCAHIMIDDLALPDIC